MTPASMRARTTPRAVVNDRADPDPDRAGLSPIAAGRTAAADMAVGDGSSIGAGAHSSFYGWSVIVLEAASVAALYTVILLRQVNFSTPLRTGLRLAASLAITIVGTALLSLALAWVKQSH